MRYKIPILLIFVFIAISNQQRTELLSQLRKILSEINLQKYIDNEIDRNKNDYTLYKSQENSYEPRPTIFIKSLKDSGQENKEQHFGLNTAQEEGNRCFAGTNDRCVANNVKNTGKELFENFYDINKQLRDNSKKNINIQMNTETDGYKNIDFLDLTRSAETERICRDTGICGCSRNKCGEQLYRLIRSKSKYFNKDKNIFPRLKLTNVIKALLDHGKQSEHTLKTLNRLKNRQIESSPPDLESKSNGKSNIIVSDPTSRLCDKVGRCGCSSYNCDANRSKKMANQKSEEILRNLSPEYKKINDFRKYHKSLAHGDNENPLKLNMMMTNEYTTLSSRDLKKKYKAEEKERRKVEAEIKKLEKKQKKEQALKEKRERAAQIKQQREEEREKKRVEAEIKKLEVKQRKEQALKEKREKAAQIKKQREEEREKKRLEAEIKKLEVKQRKEQIKKQKYEEKERKRLEVQYKKEQAIIEKRKKAEELKKKLEFEKIEIERKIIQELKEKKRKHDEYWATLVGTYDVRKKKREDAEREKERRIIEELERRQRQHNEYWGIKIVEKEIIKKDSESEETAEKISNDHNKKVEEIDENLEEYKKTENHKTENTVINESIIDVIKEEVNIKQEKHESEKNSRETTKEITEKSSEIVDTKNNKDDFLHPEDVNGFYENAKISITDSAIAFIRDRSMQTPNIQTMSKEQLTLLKDLKNRDQIKRMSYSRLEEEISRIFFGHYTDLVIRQQLRDNDMIHIPQWLFDIVKIWKNSYDNYKLQKSMVLKNPH